MSRRAQIVWFLILLGIIFGCWMLSQRKANAFDWRPTQGAGAVLLRSKRMAAPALPPALPEAMPLPARTYYNAVTAVGTGGLESLYSNEVAVTNKGQLAFAWDGPTNGAPVTNYVIHRGIASTNYTATFSAGTNLTLKVPPPPPKYLVITVPGYTPLTNPMAPMQFWTGRNLTISAKRY